MAGNHEWRRMGESESSALGEAPTLQETQAFQPASEEVRLRIVYNRDAQQGSPTMHVQRPQQGTKRPNAMLDSSLQAKIGHMLREIFSDVAKEPVPTRFAELLNALAAKEKTR